MVPLRRSVSIATSTARQDAGVFEFNFHDERYMPFEGSGVDSSWTLSLPSTFKTFDYRTITDVVIHVTYTALADETRRQRLEEDDVTKAGTLRNQLSLQPLKRVFSLRHDFSAAFTRLLHNPVGTAVPLDIAVEHFPLFLQRRTLNPTAVLLAVATAPGQPVGDLRISVDDSQPGQFNPCAFLGGLPALNIGDSLPGDITPESALRCTMKVVSAGDIGVTAPKPSDPSALDDSKVDDILLYMEYLVP